MAAGNGIRNDCIPRNVIAAKKAVITNVLVLYVFVVFESIVSSSSFQINILGIYYNISGYMYMLSLEVFDKTRIKVAIPKTFTLFLLY